MDKMMAAIEARVIPQVSPPEMPSDDFGQMIADNLNRNVMAREASNIAIAKAQAEGKPHEEALRLGQEAYDAARVAWRPKRDLPPEG